jgi:hypothetical protein
VVSHLLQNDLMRVGPSLAELVPCLFDPVAEIVKLARGFFTELRFFYLFFFFINLFLF